MRIITGKSKSEGLLNFLFKHGHPICISNRSDPFSASNINDTLAVLKVLAQQPNGIFFQTKSGARVDDALDILREKKEVVFYITITTMRNDISKRMEPGAPLPDERVKFAKHLKMKGYEVIVAVNPCFEPWMPENDLIALENELTGHGISHFVFQRLMLNRKDIGSFSAFRMSQFTDGELERAVAKKDIYFQGQVERQLKKGLDTVAFGMPFKTGFFRSINNVLPGALNNLYALIGQCSSPREIRFDEYLETMTRGSAHLLSYSGKEIAKYILIQNRAVWKLPKYQRVNTFFELLKAFWNNKRLGASPQNNFLFRVITEKGKPVEDSGGNIVLWYDGETHRKQREVDLSERKEVQK